MLAILKLIQSIIKTLHSDGAPGQVAAGIALGSALGLTPLVNVHTLIVFSLIVLLNISFGGGMLGWALFVPLGCILDPVFDVLGQNLLQASSLRGLWTSGSSGRRGRDLDVAGRDAATQLEGGPGGGSGGHGDGARVLPSQDGVPSGPRRTG